MIELLDSGIIKTLIVFVGSVTVAIIAFAGKIIIGSKANRIAEIHELTKTFKDSIATLTADLEREKEKNRILEEAAEGRE